MIKMHTSHLGMQHRSGPASLHRRQASPPAPSQQRPSVPLADALWTKNLRELSQKTTPEDLAVALDMPLPRLQELLQGVNFSQEMVYHLEVALKLSPGFFSQVNPKIPQETLDILANPASHAERAEDSHTQEVSSRSSPEQAPALVSPVKPAEETASASASSSAHQPPVLSVVRPMEPPMNAASQSTDDIFATRRNNLNLLTSVKGSKSALARMLGISAAVMSHRLHGIKKIHEEDAKQICDLLSLPADWFEVPKAAAELPSDLAQRMSMAPPAAVATSAVRTPGNRGRRKALEQAQGTASQQPAAPMLQFGAQSSETASAAPAAPAAPMAAPASVTPLRAAPSQARASSEQAVVIDEHLFATARLQPIAEALIKVMIVRAQRGELTEATALRMLSEMVGS